MDTTTAVLFNLSGPGGEAEGAGTSASLLPEGWSAGVMLRVTPVFDGGSEVHKNAFGDSAGHVSYEGVISTFAGIVGFVEVLPGRPGHPVGTAEAVGGDA